MIIIHDTQDPLSPLRMSASILKKAFFLLLMIVLSPSLEGQTLADTFREQYMSKESDAEKGKFIFYFFRDSLLSVPEKFELLADQLAIFKEQKDETGINYAYLVMSSLARRTGEYPTSLKYGIDALHNFEKVKDTTGIIRSLNEITNAFTMSGNPRESVAYWRKALLLAKQHNDKAIYSLVLNNVADYYMILNQPDSALPYIQEAVAISYEIKNNYNLGVTLGTLGEVYLLLGEDNLALPFLNKSIHYSTLARSPGHLAYFSNVLSDYYYRNHESDSSIMYAREVIGHALPEDKRNLMLAFEKLYQNFESLNQQDSVNKYYRMAMSSKDSLFTMEKARSILLITFTEQLRQQEEAEEQERVATHRKQNLQYAILGIGIILFLMAFLLLSRSVITNTRVIKFLGVMALLIVFEFFNLWLHPFLERITHHSPALILLILVCIASVLVPLHHRVEKWAVNRLIEKNKAIRLAAAKRTIEELEQNETGPD